MKNITITLDDEMAHRAKVFAAEHNTSVSKFLGALLSERIERELTYRAAADRWRARTLRAIQRRAKPYPSRDALHAR